MHERQGAGEPLVGEVGEERLELAGREHPLVEQRARRQRREVDAQRRARRACAAGRRGAPAPCRRRDRPDEPTNSCRNTGMTARAVAPTRSGTVGRSRQPTTQQALLRGEVLDPGGRSVRRRRPGGTRCRRRRTPARAARSRRPRAGTRRAPGRATRRRRRCRAPRRRRRGARGCAGRSGPGRRWCGWGRRRASPRRRRRRRRAPGARRRAPEGSAAPRGGPRPWGCSSSSGSFPTGGPVGSGWQGRRWP